MVFINTAPINRQSWCLPLPHLIEPIYTNHTRSGIPNCEVSSIGDFYFFFKASAIQHQLSGYYIYLITQLHNFKNLQFITEITYTDTASWQWVIFKMFLLKHSWWQGCFRGGGGWSHWINSPPHLFNASWCVKYTICDVIF